MEAATASPALSFSPFPALLKKHFLKAALSQRARRGNSSVGGKKVILSHRSTPGKSKIS